MNFQSRDSPSSPLFRSNNILKLEDKMLIENILFINKSFKNLLPPIFKVGSPSALIFTIITQFHLLLIRYLNFPKELIHMERIQSLQEPVIVGIKLNISSVMCHLKHSAQPKLKVYFLKNALENINGKVKGVFLIKQTNLL